MRLYIGLMEFRIEKEKNFMELIIGIIFLLIILWLLAVAWPLLFYTKESEVIVWNSTKLSNNFQKGLQF